MEKKMNRFNDLCVFFEEYASFLEDMELVQKEKLESVLSGDLQRMESSIKTQQAYAMRLENIESKRIRTQEAAGFSNYTFSQLIEAAEPAVRNELRALLVRAQNALSNIQHFNSKALEVSRENLRTLEAEGVTDLKGHSIESRA
jgi:hypothetical protein